MSGGAGESLAGVPGEDVGSSLQSDQAQAGPAADSGLQRPPGQTPRDWRRPKRSLLQQGEV